MKAAVALAVSISLLGCFPNNARHRTYAKIAEGTAVVGGIVISAVGNTGADCDQMTDEQREDCRSTARLLSTIGVVLILGGLLGFVATVSTAQDDSESTPRVISREKTDATGAGSGSAAPTDGTGAGSAAPGATEGSAVPPAPPATDSGAAGGTLPEGTGVPAPNQFQWQ